MHMIMKVKMVIINLLDSYNWLKSLHILMECHMDHIMKFIDIFLTYLILVYLIVKLMDYNV